ncbi:MAG TPA: hypothetical protein VGP80_05085 [Gemmatimonadales bacterium]|jgi:hypothetical protein|nr:hypothetical protein [Gemmatimonadales bacterium]
MKALALAAALAAASMIPASVSAQHVSVSAVIVIGNPHPSYDRVYRDSRPRYYDYRPARRVYVEQRYPRVIYVRRVHRHYDHRFKSRRVRAYYDHSRDQYYGDYRPGLREVAVYEHGDEYYRYDDD